MNTDKSIEQRVIEQRKNSGPWAPYNNFKDTVHYASLLEDIAKVGDFTNAIRSLIDTINKQQENLEEDSKDRSKLIDLMSKLKTYSDDARGSKDWNKTGASIQKAMKDIDKSLYLLKGESLDELRKLYEEHADLIEASNAVFERINKKMQTFSENLSDNLSKVSNNIKEWANFLNLQQIAFGGKTLEDLRNMQSEIKKTLNISNSGFRAIQGNLISQNRESFSSLGLDFSDSVNYMASIKDYSMKNYNQSVALYKQVSVGTKYLGLTSQNISDLVKVQNAMADSDYMSKQMALLATLGTDSGLAENMGDLVSFINQNATSVGSRYKNANQMLTDSLAIKSVSDALFGNESSLVSNLMAEIMSKSDYSQLSAGTQQLLAYTGQANDVWAQMRSGNVDFNRVITGVLSNTSGLDQYQKTNLENLGLGDWVTIGGTYSRNGDEYRDTLNKQLEVLSSIDITNEEQRDAALQQLNAQNNNKTWYEKMIGWIGNELSIQNLNWNDLLGMQQAITGFLTGAMFLLDTKRNALLAGILGKESLSDADLTKLVKGGKVASWLGSSTMKAHLGFGSAGTLSNGAALSIGALGIGGGILMGINQGNKMKEQGGSFARGLFLGTGYKGKEGGNLGSIAGNTAKYAAIGAGIGTLIPVVGTLVGGVVGAAAGLITGISGATKELEKNTKSTDKNTDAFKSTQDSIYTNSAIARFYEGSGTGGPEGFGIGGKSNDAGYPWRITSGYGMRWHPIKHKYQMHNGVDFGARKNTPIGAAMGGKVSYVGWYGGGGNTTIIKGDDGWTYKYMHQIKKPPLKKGQRVAAGDTIGWVGSTGDSTGPHLHFQVDKGTNKTSTNPLPYVTAGLFSASGKVWNPPKKENNYTATESDYENDTPQTDDSTTYALVKESLFDTGSSTGTGGKSEEMIGSSSNNYATSADIDRLIKAITTVRDEQEEQRSMMRALAGKNTFVFSGR